MNRFLLSLLASLSVLLSGNLYAVDYVWDAGGDGDSWHDGLNWDLDAYPDAAWHSAFISGTASEVSIDSNAVLYELDLSNGSYDNGGELNVEPNSTLRIKYYLNMGCNDGDGGKVNINGGTLNLGVNGNGLIKVYGDGHEFNLNDGTVNIWHQSNWDGLVRMGHEADANALNEFNINGGTFNAVGIKLGYTANSGTNNLNMTGGTLNLTGNLDVANASNTTAHVQFDGGVINATNVWINNDPCTGYYGTMDMTGLATLILDGDRVNLVNGWISAGKLTAYDGNGFFNVNYNTINSGKTTVTVFPYYQIVGYTMGGWQDIYENATCVNVAFQKIDDDGSLGTLTPGESNLIDIVSSAHENGVRVVISVGGGDTDQYYKFQTVAASSTLRDTLISNLATFVDTYDLDGVDIDWERPSAGSEVNDYVLLMEELYDEFNPKGKLVTTALTANPDSIVTWLPTSVFDSLDYVNIMSYDVIAERLTYSYFVNGMDVWLDKGLSAEKIVMGIPFYGRHEDTNDAKLYRELITLDSNAPYKDDVNGYVYNGLRTAKRKTRLAIDNDCAGVMIWQLAGDKYEDEDVSLLKAIRSEMDLECLEFYSTQFDNNDVLDDWSGNGSWSNYWSLEVGLGEGQLVTTAGNQNTSVWYDANLPDNSSPYDLEDYVVTAEIDASNDFTQISITARVTDASNFYQFKYNPDNDTIVLLGYSSGTCIFGVSQAVTETVPDIYTLSLMVSGNTLKGELIDPVYGTVIATVSTTNSALSSGTAGFRAYNTTAEINNFRISDF